MDVSIKTGGGGKSTVGPKKAYTIVPFFSSRELKEKPRKERFSFVSFIKSHNYSINNGFLPRRFF